MIFYTREEVVAMTPLWKGERFEDGRPKVADRYLDALYAMTLEELWKPIFVQGYENNFVSIKPLHPDRPRRHRHVSTVSTRSAGFPSG